MSSESNIQRMSSHHHELNNSKRETKTFSFLSDACREVKPRAFVLHIKYELHYYLQASIDFNLHYKLCPIISQVRDTNKIK